MLGNEEEVDDDDDAVDVLMAATLSKLKMTDGQIDRHT